MNHRYPLTLFNIADLDTDYFLFDRNPDLDSESNRNEVLNYEDSCNEVVALYPKFWILMYSIILF